MDDVQRLLKQARALESEGRLDAALDAYHAAFSASGEDPAVAADLGRVALKLGQPKVAEQLLLIHLGAEPRSVPSRLNLGAALREQQRYDEALGVLTEAVQAAPTEPALWSGVGVALVQAGRAEESLPFFSEALRLDPGFGSALYHRANALFDLNRHQEALADYVVALGVLPEEDRDRVRTPMGLSMLAVGALREGWDAYRARLSPRSLKPIRFEVRAKPWPFDPDEPADALEGRSLLLMAEQGLGDEVMFANVVPDVQTALGPKGRLTLAVEPRLVALFARSFPRATVVGHRTRSEGGVITRSADLPEPVQFWAPLAAPLRRFRRKVSDFPAETAYLTPDLDRVAHWRAWLAAVPGRKAGLLWKSLKLEGERHRAFAAFDAWAPVLRAPAVRFVNLQYGDCSAELAYARDVLGVDILQPPEIDLKDDLDDVAALSAALDLVIGFSNASLQIAGAVGAPLWLIAEPSAWSRLGSRGYPWHPQARVFEADGEGWAGALKAVAAAL